MLDRRRTVVGREVVGCVARQVPVLHVQGAGAGSRAKNCAPVGARDERAASRRRRRARRGRRAGGGGCGARRTRAADTRPRRSTSRASRPRDEEARDDEEHVDADEARRERGGPEVVEHDEPIATARRAWISGRTEVRAAVAEDEDISTSVGSPRSGLKTNAGVDRRLSAPRNVGTSRRRGRAHAASAQTRPLSTPGHRRRRGRAHAASAQTRPLSTLDIDDEGAGPEGPTRRFRTREGCEGCYLMIFVTVPAPTVRPPSRMAKPRPSSMAIGWISSTVMSVVSPGMTISVPSGSVMTPVTSVVRK